MARPISDSLHILPRAGSGQAAWHRIRLGDERWDLPESWIQERITQNPDLVVGACRAFGFVDPDEEWRVWKRELVVPGVGSVDLALVSSDGRVALIEAKLARNPENRRKVLAQILEYAIHLREAHLDDLPELPNDSGAVFADPEDVQRHLREGDFLLVIAADAGDERAAKLTRALLDRNAIHPWDLALVDLALFAPNEGSGADLICVPHVIGGVRCESRHVVEVKVSNTAEGASVVVQLAEPEQVKTRPTAWTRDTFRVEFTRQAQTEALRDHALAWLALVESTPGFSVRYGGGKFPSALFEHGGRTYASVDRNSIWIYGQRNLRDAFGDQVGVQRWNDVRALFPDRPDRMQYFQVPARDPRVAQAIDLVRSWTRA